MICTVQHNGQGPMLVMSQVFMIMTLDSSRQLCHFHLWDRSRQVWKLSLCHRLYPTPALQCVHRNRSSCLRTRRCRSLIHLSLPTWVSPSLHPQKHDWDCSSIVRSCRWILQLCNCMASPSHLCTCTEESGSLRLDLPPRPVVLQPTVIIAADGPWPPYFIISSSSSSHVLQSPSFFFFFPPLNFTI